MPNGSNCALNHGAQLNSGVLYRITVINVQMTCQQYCYIPHVYENGNKVCLKAFASIKFIHAFIQPLLPFSLNPICIADMSFAHL